MGRKGRRLKHELDFIEAFYNSAPTSGPATSRMPKKLIANALPDIVTPAWQLPKRWIWTVVDRVGAVQVGKQLTQERRSGDVLIKYVRAANISAQGIDLEDLQEMGITPAEVARYALQAGDVLLTEASGSSAHVGKSAVWRGEVAKCCIQNTVIRFRPHAVVPDYAQLVFRGFLVMGIFAKVARGVGIQHLGGERFAALPFPLPPFETQKRIVTETTQRLQAIGDARSSLESALRGLKRKTDTLLELAATGKLVRHGRPMNKSIGAPPDELPLSEGNQQATEKLSVPSHWRVMRITDAGEVRLGRERNPTHEHGDNMMPYLRVANVFEDRIDTSDVLKMNFTPEEQKIYRLQPGDILLNEGQSPELVGRPALYRGEPAGVCFQKTLVRFRAGESVDPQFALIVFRHYFRSGRFTRIARGSTNISHLSAKRFAELPFPVPPLEEQRVIVDTVKTALVEDAEQEKVVAMSLEKLQPAELDLLRTALSGGLVAEDSSGESAGAMLDRLGAPLKQKIEKETTPKTPRPMKTNRAKKNLVDVLKSAGGRLSAEDLFESAGYDRDASEDIERFYLQLRAEMKRTIRQSLETDGRTMLEAI